MIHNPHQRPCSPSPNLKNDRAHIKIAELAESDKIGQNDTEHSELLLTL